MRIISFAPEPDLWRRIETRSEKCKMDSFLLPGSSCRGGQVGRSWWGGEGGVPVEGAAPWHWRHRRPGGIYCDEKGKVICSKNLFSPQLKIFNPKKGTKKVKKGVGRWSSLSEMKGYMLLMLQQCLFLLYIEARLLFKWGKLYQQRWDRGPMGNSRQSYKNKVELEVCQEF